MITFGFITLHPSQENKYITEIAKRAEFFNITVYRFTPTSIDPATENVHGEVFNCNTKQWESKVFPLPVYLYDRCFYTNGDEISKRSQPIMSWLKNRPSSIFIGHGLPNKWNIYKTLKENETLSAYTPATVKATSVSSIINKLIKEKRILLKPESGSQGKGIVGLIVAKGGVEVLTHKDKSRIVKNFSSKNEFSRWLGKLISSQFYLCQSLLPLQDGENRPFDIRILLQKNETGEWIEQGRGVRKGKPDYLISNVSAGGEVFSFDLWLQTVPLSKQTLLIDGIDTIIRHVPKVVETHFGSLFELGIDIGLGTDGGVWILDVNSKPGRKVVLQTDINKNEDLYKSPLRYCTYLEKQASLKGVEINESIISTQNN